MCNDYRAYNAFEYRGNATEHYVDNVEQREPDDARREHIRRYGSTAFPAVYYLLWLSVATRSHTNNLQS